MKAKTIIFDLDGTLLNTLDDITNAVNYALGKCGLAERNSKEVCAFLGDGYQLLMERAVGDETSHSQKAFEYFTEYYSVHFEDVTCPYEGIIDALKSLYEDGKKMAIVSNKGNTEAQILCKKFFYPYIAEYVGVTADLPKKPAPQMLYLAMDRLGAEKDSTIMVGDSEPDIQMANAAGIGMVSVSWGYRTREQLLAQGVSKILDSVSELKSL